VAQALIPIGSLLQRWRERNPEHQPNGCVCTIGGTCGSTESLARAVGVSHSTMHRRLRRGGFDDCTEADRWACAIGLPAVVVWPEWGSDLFEPDYVGGSVP